VLTDLAQMMLKSDGKHYLPLDLTSDQDAWRAGNGQIQQEVL